jgi:uncharacterized protein YcbX
VIVSSLHIYPVKSLKGIYVSKVGVSFRGLDQDRRWMVVDDQGIALTQREFPFMSQLETELSADVLRLSLSNEANLSVNICDLDDTLRKVQVWDDTVDALYAPENVSRWLSQVLKTPCHLVFMPDESVRRVDQDYALNPSDQVSFADGFPILLISQSSLDELNSRLVNPVSMNRFRPNIVVEGCEPFAEDSWKEIEINGVRYALVKPCARCVMTTINQETGEGGKEPLKTLANFRKVGQKVLFGQNVIPLSQGEIAKGNIVRVIR